MRDQLNIDTPELVDIELPVAGIGSRFIATLVDSLIWGAVFVFIVLVAFIVIPALHLFARLSANWAIGIFFLIVFLMQWGYFTLFEAFNNGRTPGKSVAKIRVIHQSGRGISFVESLGRNLVRPIDYMPSMYAVGVLCVFVTKRHQRLGDLVAGTLVVRDRQAEMPQWVGTAQWTGTSTRTITGPALTAESPISPPHLRVSLPAPALAKLSVPDLQVVEGFFARRLDMDLATRSTLAGKIATALCAKSGLEIPPETNVETFLEAVAHQLREMGRMR